MWCCSPSGTPGIPTSPPSRRVRPWSSQEALRTHSYKVGHGVRPLGEHLVYVFIPTMFLIGSITGVWKVWRRRKRRKRWRGSCWRWRWMSTSSMRRRGRRRRLKKEDLVIRTKVFSKQALLGIFVTKNVFKTWYMCKYFSRLRCTHLLATMSPCGPFLVRPCGPLWLVRLIRPCGVGPFCSDQKGLVGHSGCSDC